MTHCLHTLRTTLRCAEANKLSAGARIFKCPYRPEILVTIQNTFSEFPVITALVNCSREHICILLHASNFSGVNDPLCFIFHNMLS